MTWICETLHLACQVTLQTVRNVVWFSVGTRIMLLGSPFVFAFEFCDLLLSFLCYFCATDQVILDQFELF